MHVFIFVTIFIFNCAAFAQNKMIDAEIRKLKSEFKTSEVESVELEDGTLAVVSWNPEKKVTDEATERYADFYFKAKNETTWKHLDQIKLTDLNANFDMKNNTVIVSIEGGGSSRFEVRSVWRLENGLLKIIGEDATFYQGWALRKESSTTPYKQTISANYLSGKMTVDEEYAAGKKKRHHECAFDSDIFRQQSLTDIGYGGSKMPECPVKKYDSETISVQTKQIDGMWAIKEYQCLNNQLTDAATGLNQLIASGKYLQQLHLENGNAQFEIKLLSEKDSFSTCLHRRKEKWKLKNDLLTITGTKEEKLGIGSFLNCKAETKFPKERNQKIMIDNEKRFRMFLTATPTTKETLCKNSTAILIYEKIK